MSQSDPFSGFSESMSLFSRASKVIPAGIYGHMSPASHLPGKSPYYARSAKGCRYEDVDGNSYIDFMCAYGTIVLGYNHPEVDEAAERQRRDGDCFNHPGPAMVELAERMTSIVDFADWAVFGKNGSDMTTWTVQVAREYTGRPKVLTIAGAYHGKDPWCTPGHAGLIDTDRKHIHSFPWNDLDVFESLVKRYRDQVAALMITPFHHPVFADCEMPAPGFFESLERICKREGILIILDDVRCGVRMHLGGSHRIYGIQPDMACYSKAMGNGYSISSAVGTEALKTVAGKVFLTGSFWNSAVPMVASLKTLEIIERDNVPQMLDERGKYFRAGLEKIGEQLGDPLVCTGPPAIPFARFARDTNFHLQQRFCAEAIKRGVFLHPHHNWFLCASHTEAVIDEALEVIAASAKSMAEQA